MQAVLLKARREPWRIESVQVPFFEPPTVTKVNDKDLKRVQCLLCTEQIADGGGTSNLTSHLQAKHLEEYKRCTNDSSKTVRHRVHSIASPRCVHRSTLPPSRNVLLSLSRGIFALSVLLMSRASGLVTASFIKTWWVELCLSCSCPFALHLGYLDVENPHPLQPYYF